ncbi:MAG: GNAT family N-acetyltransferase [Pseudomonadota bacterium]
MTDVSVRSVDDSAAQELATLGASSFTQAYQGVHDLSDIKAYCDTQYSLAATLANLRNSELCYRVAYDKDHALGFSLTTQRACPVIEGSGVAELKQLYMLSDQIGTGLGTRLLDDALEIARDRGDDCMWLIVADFNQRAQAFYRKHGFEMLSAAPILIMGRYRLPATYMSKRL